MAYVFTDWEHCTNPKGDSVVLDWSEEGMAGKFPGLYLEALRQAAILRESVSQHGWTEPVEFAAHVGIDFPMGSLLDYIDAVAWDTWGVGGHGWIAPADVYDLSGETDVPGRMSTEASILEAAGYEDRIDKPDPIFGFLDGAYLRQLKAVLGIKRFWGLGEQIVTSPTTYPYGSDVGPDDTRSSDWKSSYADAVSDWDSKGWTTLDISSSPQHVLSRGADGKYAVWRYARNQRWRNYIWPTTSGVPCSYAYLYLHSARPSGVTYWSCPDFSFVDEDTWLLVHEGADLTTYMDEWIGKIGSVTITDSPGLSNSESRGYEIDSTYILLDYSADWALGA